MELSPEQKEIIERLKKICPEEFTVEKTRESHRNIRAAYCRHLGELAPLERAVEHVFSCPRCSAELGCITIYRPKAPT